MVGNFGTNVGVVSPWPLVSKLVDFREPLFPSKGEKVGCFYGNNYRRLPVSRLADFSGARERKSTVSMETNTGGRNLVSGGKQKAHISLL